jgi:hypothetical protein
MSSKSHVETWSKVKAPGAVRRDRTILRTHLTAVASAAQLFFVAATPALADEAPIERTRAAETLTPTEPSLLSELSSGSDLLDSAPAIAFLDGPWSMALHIGTLLVTRNWDAPYPEGLIAHASTRVLYGTSWSLMLTLESFAAALASGGRFDWLAEATYRSDFTFGVDGASCPTPGANGGCGVGIGGYGGIYARPAGSRFWFEVTGGWLEQRVKNDERGTLAESVWVLAPFTVTADVEAKSGPLALGLRAGPGVYWGMHNAHFHPTPEYAGSFDARFTELYPIDYGLGPGARVETRLTFLRRLSLSAELVLAPLLLSKSNTLPARLAPIDDERGDLVTWRTLALGATWDDPSVMPMTIGASVFGAELSRRPLTEVGQRGFFLRFDFPLRTHLVN